MVAAVKTGEKRPPPAAAQYCAIHVRYPLSSCRHQSSHSYSEPDDEAAGAGVGAAFAAGASLATGVLGADGAAEDDGVLPAGVAVGAGVGVTVGLAVAVGEGVGDGVGDGEGDGVAVACTSAGASCCDELSVAGGLMRVGCAFSVGRTSSVI